MDLKRTTKAKLAEALDEQRETIEKLKNQIVILKHDEQCSFDKYRNEVKKVKEAEDQIKLLNLENIADMKSLQNMLAIYMSEEMTHREKAYLGRKLNQVIEGVIKDKINALKEMYDYNSHLPF